MGAPLVALLTDFGNAELYAGVMRAVIARLAPRARTIDLTHDIPPGDVATAAFRLWQAAPHLPDRTVVLAVVDPGVGTERRAVAVAFPRLLCVGPDNGIFTYLLAAHLGAPAVEIRQSGGGEVSATFHGRDVFAPAAARLAAGAPLSRLGAPAAGLVRLPLPRLELGGAAVGESVTGVVVCVDRFGNAITSIGALRREAGRIALAPWLPGCAAAAVREAGARVELPGGRAVPLARTFADVPEGSPVAYIGSDGLLEIAVNRGSAREALGLAPGAEVTLASPTP
jgi:S-adenosylmethionine hydrolase